MELEGQSVVVVGLARSGIAAASYLAGSGAVVLATDRKPAGELQEEVLSLESQGVTLALGGHPEEAFTRAAMIVVSPGVPWDLPELEAARRAGVRVMAELELAYRQMAGTLAAVTGTKGKSTTTAALGAMLKESGKDVRVGGNIGEPLIGQIRGAKAKTIFAVEASSFQLEGVTSFRPKVAVFLNLSEDHLDRHKSFEDYALAKARIFMNQTGDDWAVVNGDDPRVMALAREGRGRLVVLRARAEDAFSEAGDVATFDGDRAVLLRNGLAETLFLRSSARVPGPHLAGDLLAAAVAARILGAEADAIARAVERFSGVEHVLESVPDVGGVHFFNDSKATNVASARKAIEAFEGPLHVVLGGRYKGGDFGDLGGVLKERGKTVLAIGEARERIASALKSLLPVVSCSSMGEAVREAYRRAVPGDTVLLAPACSSFDMFKDYAERGRAFKEAVEELRRSLG